MMPVGCFNASLRYFILKNSYLKTMGFNLKTLDLEISVVKHCGQRRFVLINLDGEYDCTNNLLHPITDAQSNAVYSKLKQTMAELHERKKKETKWTCKFENCGLSYNNADSFLKHK